MRLVSSINGLLTSKKSPVEMVDTARVKWSKVEERRGEEKDKKRRREKTKYKVIVREV